MNKKGFTLIELAAVILVLAILALIATPIIMNTIENAKKGAAERSADHYINAVNTTAAMDGIANGLLEDGIYKVIENGNLCKYFYYDEEGELKKSNTDCSTTPSLVVDVKGDLPLVGSGVEIKDGQVLKEGSLVKFNNYEVKYPEGTAKAYKWASLDDMCTHNSEYTFDEKTFAANEVGAQYTCDLGDGNRTFYILEAGTLSQPATLILEGNYDDSAYPWCANKRYNNKCAADGLTEQLDNIIGAWTKIDASQVGLPIANQILKASDLPENEPTSSKRVAKWLSPTPTEASYWTSTPATEWPTYSAKTQSAIIIARGDKRGGWAYETNVVNNHNAVRPVVKFTVDIFADSTN